MNELDRDTRDFIRRGFNRELDMIKEFKNWGNDIPDEIKKKMKQPAKEIKLPKIEINE